MIAIYAHGRLTRDPELRQTTGGKSVCSFTVASNKRNRDDGADFLDCTAWGALGEMIHRNFCKGKEIALGGMLSSRKYQDKAGNNRTAWEATVEHVEFCGSKADVAADGAGADARNADAPTYNAPAAPPPENVDITVIDVDAEDLPF